MKRGKQGTLSKPREGKMGIKGEEIGRKAEEVNALEWIDGMRKGFRRES